jgi:hypothetical protein
VGVDPGRSARTGDRGLDDSLGRTIGGDPNDRWSISPPIPHAAPLLGTGSEIHELRAELAHEREAILGPLLLRLSDLGTRLLRGESVPVVVIEQGIDAWAAYLRRLREVHVGQFASAHPSLGHVGACTRALEELWGDPTYDGRWIAAYRALLRAGASPSLGYPRTLGGCLLGAARFEQVRIGIEFAFAASCLHQHLSPHELADWKAAEVTTRMLATTAQERTAAFLERTIRYALVPAPEVVPPSSLPLAAALA